MAVTAILCLYCALFCHLHLLTRAHFCSTDELPIYIILLFILLYSLIPETYFKSTRNLKIDIYAQRLCGAGSCAYLSQDQPLQK